MEIKYSFLLKETKEDDEDLGGLRMIKHTISGEQSISELIAEFEYWLRGCGFIFDGQIGLIEVKKEESRSATPGRAIWQREEDFALARENADKVMPTTPSWPAPFAEPTDEVLSGDN